MQQLFQSQTLVEGGATFKGVLPRPVIDPRADALFPFVHKQTGALEKPVIHGTVKHLARVRLNGRDLGVVWCAPWGVSVPECLLKPAGNELEVEITNVWANSLK